MDLPDPTGRLSIHVYNAILERSRMKGADLAALLILASFADDAGYIAGVSVPRLMALLRMDSERGVQKLINRLVAAGELDKKPGVGMKGVNAYEILCLTWPPEAPELPFGVNTSSGANADSKRGERQFGDGVNASSPKEQKQEHAEKKTEERENRAGARPLLHSNQTGIRKPDKSRVRQILDRHALMWDAVLTMTAGFPLPKMFWDPEKADYEQDPPPVMSAAIRAVGGWPRFKGFEKRPQDAGFARRDFLAFLINNDPEYERAVAELLEEELVRP